MLTKQERELVEIIVQDMSNGSIGLCCPEFKQRGGCARCTGARSESCLHFNLASNLVKKGYRPPNPRTI